MGDLASGAAAGAANARPSIDPIEGIQRIPLDWNPANPLMAGMQHGAAMAKLPIEMAYQMARERYYDAHAQRYDDMTRLQEQKLMDAEKNTGGAIDTSALDSDTHAPSSDELKGMGLGGDSADADPSAGGPGQAPPPRTSQVDPSALIKLGVNPDTAARLDPSLQDASQAAWLNALTQATQGGPQMADNAPAGSVGDTIPTQSQRAAVAVANGSNSASDGLTPSAADMEHPAPKDQDSGPSLGSAISTYDQYRAKMEADILRQNNKIRGIEQISRLLPVTSPQRQKLAQQQVSALAEYQGKQNALNEINQQFMNRWKVPPQQIDFLRNTVRDPKRIDAIDAMVQKGDAPDHATAYQTLLNNLQAEKLQNDPRFVAKRKQEALTDGLNILAKRNQAPSGDEWSLLDGLAKQKFSEAGVQMPQSQSQAVDPLAAQFDRVRRIDALDKAGISKVSLDKEDPRDVKVARAAEMAKAKQIAVENGVHFTIPRIDNSDPQTTAQVNGLMQKWAAAPANTAFMIQHDQKDQNPEVVVKRPVTVRDPSSGKMITRMPTAAEWLTNRFGKSPLAETDSKSKSASSASGTSYPAGSGDIISNETGGLSVPLSALDEISRRNAAAKATLANKSLPSDISNAIKSLADGVKADALTGYDDWKTGANVIANSSLGKWALGTND